MKRFLNIPIFLMLFLLIAVSFTGYRYIHYIFFDKTQRQGYIYISSRDSFNEVVKQIKPFVNTIKGFKWVAQRKKYPSLIKGGKYKIEKGWSIPQLIDHLRSGNQEEVKIQLNQIETENQLAGKAARQIEADSSSIIHYLNQREFLKKNQLTKETVLQIFLANTYYFHWNTSAKQFVERMKREYHKFWNDQRIEKAKALNMSPLEVMSLAAIVEKETAKPDERPKVARLYLNRLKYHWKLQSDPTVIYAVKKRIGFDTIIKRVLNKHLEEKSSYNTYLNYGLPPAPIVTPSPASVDAVLSAPPHNYLYMCASVERKGYHAFSKTLAQHEINRRKYIKWLDKKHKS